MKNKYIERSNAKRREKAISKQLIIGVLIYVPFIMICACLQSSTFKIFSMPPSLCLLVSCAMGMLINEKVGAISGIFSGFIIDAVGGGIFAVSPLFYMLCGYFCGVMVKFVLSANFPSYFVYMLAVGVLKELLNVFYFGMMSGNLNLVELLFNTLIPDYFAFLIFSPAVYLFVYLFNKIIFYKRDTKRRK